MDNPTALEKALRLNEKLTAIRASPPPPSVCSKHPCEQCRAVAAALKRAFADGMEYAAECELAAEMGSLSSDYRSPVDIRIEADQLEGK